MVLADAVKRYEGAPVPFVRELLLDPLRWLILRRGEICPAAVADETGRVVTWTSLWPVAPEDTIVLELSRHGGGTALRFLWHTESPPDDRGVGKVRYRLNQIFGDNLRDPTSGWAWSDQPGFGHAPRDASSGSPS